MNKSDIIKLASEFVEASEYNYITKEIAISDDLVGMKIFDAPIFGFAASDDECFETFKKPDVIGEHFMLPKEWLPNSKTVISFFLPFNERVKKSNCIEKELPSDEWLHGRIEGQILIDELCVFLNSKLINAGYKSIIPAFDERYWSQKELYKGSHPDIPFTSTWSERHAAFVAGLGTFSLSKGLITSKGVAGRFGSIITELYLPADKRDYEDIYEYCSMCGVCVKKCPVSAISIEKGKDHTLCSRFLEMTEEKYSPRYGCGKCQVGVPCESGIPKVRE